MSNTALQERLRDFFRQHGVAFNGSKIAAVYLFGSQARNTAKHVSDIDIGLLLEQDPPPGLDGLCQRLASELETFLKREVDLVVLNTACADLVHRVLKDGIFVLDTNPSFRIRFEVKKRNEYFDLLPILREYRRQKRDAT